MNDNQGNLSKATYKNGMTTDYTYNMSNCVTSVTNKMNGNVISQFNYEYYYDSNVYKKTDNNGNNTTYSYNYAGMLTLENETLNGVQSTRSYTYDKAGNRKSLNSTGGEVYQTNYWYDENNRLVKDTTVKGNETETMYYRYDNNGNQVLKFNGISKKSTADGLKLGATTITGNKSDKMVYQTFNYDGFNQLIGIQMNGSKCNSVGYTYRPDGLRLSKNVNNSANRSYYIWNGDKLQAEINSNGQIKSYNVYGNGLVKSDTYDSSNNPISVYYAKNAHGDVVNLTNDNGNTIKNYQYDAFGIELNKDENDFNPFRYCGEYFDNETDNYYLRARYYNPRLGRFISEDPIQYGMNWYAYCHNNPINFMDRTGLSEDKKAAITITESKNKIEIKAYVSFTGEKDEKTGISSENKIIPGSEMTYREAAIIGIEEGWSGEYNGKAVTTEVIDITGKVPDDQNVLIIDIRDYGDVSQQLYWKSYSEPGKLLIFTKYYGYNFGRINEQDISEYDENKFKYLSAHEFGHAIGLYDVYSDDKIKNKPVSLMKYQNEVKGKAQFVDFDVMLKNYHEGRRRAYSEVIDGDVV